MLFALSAWSGRSNRSALIGCWQYLILWVYTQTVFRNSKWLQQLKESHSDDGDDCPSRCVWRRPEPWQCARETDISTLGGSNSCHRSLQCCYSLLPSLFFVLFFLNPSLTLISSLFRSTFLFRFLVAYHLISSCLASYYEISSSHFCNCFFFLCTRTFLTPLFTFTALNVTHDSTVTKMTGYVLNGRGFNSQ